MTDEQQKRLLEDTQKQIEELEHCLNIALNMRDYIKEQKTDE